MKNIGYGLLVIVLCTARICDAAQQADSMKVASQGTTAIAAVFGAAPVSIKITTHEIDIGKPSDAPGKRLGSCTYSRFPCVAVDDLDISVNGKRLFVPRSVYADLTDINVASLHQEKKQYVLTLLGGDASESYTVNVFFNGAIVKERTL